MKAIIIACLVAYVASQAPVAVDKCTPFRDSISAELVKWETTFNAQKRVLQAIVKPDPKPEPKPVAPTPPADFKGVKPTEPTKPVVSDKYSTKWDSEWALRNSFLDDFKATLGNDVATCETECVGKTVASASQRVLQAVDPVPPAGLATDCNNYLKAACAAAYTPIPWPANKRALQAAVTVDASVDFGDAMDAANKAMKDAANAAGKATGDLMDGISAGLNGGAKITINGETKIDTTGKASVSQATGCTDVANCAWVQNAIQTRVAVATQLDMLNNKGCLEIPTKNRRLTLWGAKGRILQAVVPKVKPVGTGEAPSAWVAQYGGNGNFCQSDFWVNLNATMIKWTEATVGGATVLDDAHAAKVSYDADMATYTPKQEQYEKDLAAYNTDKDAYDKLKADYDQKQKEYEAALKKWEEDNKKPDEPSKPDVKTDTTDYATQWGKKVDGKWAFNQSGYTADQYNTDCKAKWTTLQTKCTSATGPKYVDVPTLQKAVTEILTVSGIDAAGCSAKMIAAAIAMIAAMFY